CTGAAGPCTPTNTPTDTPTPCIGPGGLCTPTDTPTDTATPCPTCPTSTPTSTPCGGGPCNDYTVMQGYGHFVPATTDIGNHCDDCTTTISLPFPITLYCQT